MSTLRSWQALKDTDDIFSGNTPMRFLQPSQLDSDSFFRDIMSPKNDSAPDEPPPSYDSIEKLDPLTTPEAYDAESAARMADEFAEGSEIAEAAEAATTSLAGPATIAMMVGQQLGSAVSSGVSNIEEQKVTNAMVYNSQLPGIGSGQQTSLIQSNMQQNVNSDRTAMNIGALVAGPLGALIGHAVASAYFSSPLSSQSLETAYLFGGRVNPQDTGVAASLSTAAASGVTDQIQQ